MPKRNNNDFIRELDAALVSVSRCAESIVNEGIRAYHGISSKIAIHPEQFSNTIGEVTADIDSYQVMVITLADMFNIGQSLSKQRSALLGGPTSDEALK